MPCRDARRRGPGGADRCARRLPRLRAGAGAGAGRPPACFQAPASGGDARAVRVRGRLSFGFAVAADGYASFLRLEDARVATGLRRG